MGQNYETKYWHQQDKDLQQAITVNITVQNNNCENVKGNWTQELFHKYVEYDYPGEHSPE